MKCSACFDAMEAGAFLCRACWAALAEATQNGVRLARRTRASAFPADHVGEERRSPRLHFVRGHWRRYANHKTWLKWFLRGDPDLGFIDKHYRL